MKKKRKKDYFKFLISLILILATITIILITIETGTFNKKEEKEITINLVDKCTLMFGTIIHQIKTENNCLNICENECVSQNKKITNITFISKNDDCNKCICHCK